MRDIEPLESRRLLSTGTLAVDGSSTKTAVWVASSSGGTVNFVSNGTAFFTVGNDITKTGTLVIKGTAGDDHLQVIRDGNKIKYHKIFTYNGLDGAPVGTSAIDVVVDASKVKRVRIEGLGGDDRVFVDNELAKPCTVLGGGGDDVIDGNNGATLLGGAGDDKLSVSPDGAHSAYLSGGDGNDTLVANAATDTVIGGHGDDDVIGRFNAVVTPLHPLTPTAAEIFGERASGVEQIFGEVRISHAAIE